MRPLTWVQVCHAGVAVTRGCAVIIAGLGFPEGCPGARRPVTVPLVFLPLPLVQEAGGHVLHTLLLTLFIWKTGQDTAQFSPCLPVLQTPVPQPTVYKQAMAQKCHQLSPYQERREASGGVGQGARCCSKLTSSGPSQAPGSSGWEGTEGHGAQLQLGLEAVPACHQEETEPSHSGTEAGSRARKLAFADPWPEAEGQE